MPAPSPTQRYAARVDAELKTLPTDEARREFLAREERKWIARYELFQWKVSNHQVLTADDGTAWDYVETLAHITSRLAPLRREVANA